ncbi:MAG: enoyl-CoA hydratase/isomerase family protein [Caldilineales bacterium]|nr:enoyl-CoA hydratase/isomerase family protein [Caldilineales bacterium]
MPESKTDSQDPTALAVTLPRPGVALVQIQSKPLGVLRHAVKRALQARLHELEADPDVRCLVLTGVDRAFSVGSDINDFSLEIGWLLENDYVEAGLNAALENSPLPIVAALNGFTLGGGAVLALACDIRIAAESVKIGFPEVNVGAFASGSGTQRLPRLVGRGRALDLLFTGRTIPAAEALDYGLIEYVVPDADLLDFALDYAAKIASFSAPVIAATKHCVTVGLRDGIEAGLAAEREGRVQTGRGADALEGRQAFFEKRPPVFNQQSE